MTREEKDVFDLLARNRPRHEILTMLMSRGFREAEATELLERVSRQAPPPPSNPGVEQTKVSFISPGVAMGGTLLLIGIGTALFTGWTSAWFFVIGGILLAGGLARMASGGD